MSKKFPNLLKFHGKFTDLIPNGFTFQKLFAHNYRQYSKKIHYDDSIRVWQHHGGYIEIEDFYSASKAIAEAVIKGNFPWHTYNTNLCDSLGFTIIRETDEIVPFEPEKHEAMRIYFSMERDGKPKDEIEKAVDNAYTLYRVERLSIEMFEAIKDLHAKGWIKVEA